MLLTCKNSEVTLHCHIKTTDKLCYHSDPKSEETSWFFLNPEMNMSYIIIVAKKIIKHTLSTLIRFPKTVFMKRVENTHKSI